MGPEELEELEDEVFWLLPESLGGLELALSRTSIGLALPVCAPTK